MDDGTATAGEGGTVAGVDETERGLSWAAGTDRGVSVAMGGGLCDCRYCARSALLASSRRARAAAESKPNPLPLLDGAGEVDRRTDTGIESVSGRESGMNVWLELEEPEE